MDEATQPGNDTGDTGAVDESLTPAPEGFPVAAPEAQPRGSLLLATLAALGIAALGVAAWAIAFSVYPDREFVGIIVIAAIGIGWVLREVSRSSGIAVRAIAVVVTALGCLVGSTVASLVGVAHTFHIGFWTVFKDNYDEWWRLLRDRPALQLATFGLALVVAALSVTPSKKKTPPPATTAPGSPLDEPDPAPTGD
ncbi:MAG TPA: hypothetical protein VFQ85_12190 [Mycobacteriales bacterium]|nr:hypothetical protein [Mycobacteriales bacterium]